jgi:hypothetical protein
MLKDNKQSVLGWRHSILRIQPIILSFVRQTLTIWTSVSNDGITNVVSELQMIDRFEYFLDPCVDSIMHSCQRFSRNIFCGDELERHILKTFVVDLSTNHFLIHQPFWWLVSCWFRISDLLQGCFGWRWASMSFILLYNSLVLDGANCSARSKGVAVFNGSIGWAVADANGFTGDDSINFSV